MANGATATFTMTVRVTGMPGGIVTNSASAGASTPDQVPANNTATVSTSIPAPPGIPQVFQNPALQGIFQPGNRATPTPVRPLAALPALGPQPGSPSVFTPPRTGDGGLMLRLPDAW
jgi:hypothetical protein